jgi:hypothetical protein
MQRRLPHESKQLIEQLTSWIEWRYARSPHRLVLTSAPTSVPGKLERWRPGAIWRLAWDEDGSAALYGLAPGDGPTKYYVVRQDARDFRTQGLFERLPEGGWRRLEGDNLALGRSVRSFDQSEAA